MLQLYESLSALRAERTPDALVVDVCGAYAGRWRRRRRGPGLAGVGVKPGDAEVPYETPGEITVRSNIPGAFMTGFNKEPDKTADAVVDGRFRTGDQDVKVLVRLRPSTSLVAEDLYTWCERARADLMRPRYLKFVVDSPRTETGRVHKHVLPDAGIGGSWDRDAASIKENTGG